jgi:hypothetical protein
MEEWIAAVMAPLAELSKVSLDVWYDTLVLATAMCVACFCPGAGPRGSRRGPINLSLAVIMLPYFGST